jgi:predicted transcriptional regulator
VNRLGFLVLSVLLTNGADNRMAAMSLKEIMQTEDLDVKENTLFKKLRDYEIQEYVKKGIKDGRANTFYITDAGKEFLEQYKK